MRYLISSFCLLVSITLSAQVEFFDIPDTTISTTNYGLDINNDNEIDFSIYYNSESGAPGTGFYMNAYCVIPLNNNEVLAVGHGEVCAKYKTDTISSSDEDWMPIFEYPSYYITRGSSDEAYNIRADGFDDLFIGLRLKNDDDYHYGWIQLSSEDVYTLTIKTYAFNATPNEQIVIEDSLFLFNENDYKNTLCKIYPNPARSNFTVELDNNDSSFIEVFDATGKMVFSEDFRRNIEVNSETLNTGIYILRIRNNDKIITQKLLIE